MEEVIKRELKKAEEEREIKILYAVESGSRAWGFASTNSDWDVRFIYVHKPEWYLSIDDKKDSFNYILPNDLDLSGWELRKSLKLFRKSNPPLFEWLDSPIIYSENSNTAKSLRELKKKYFSPKSCTYHYLSMAKKNYLAYLQKDIVRIKKYFYVLRPILACHWIEKNQSMAPTEFKYLLNDQTFDSDLESEIQSLLENKMSGVELAEGPRIQCLHQYLEKQLEYFEIKVKEYNKSSNLGTEPLNVLFRNTLKEVWL